MNKKIGIIVSAVALVLVVAVMAGIFFFNRPQPQAGTKTITVTVVHKDDSTKEFVYQTDGKYLGPLLVAEGLIPEGNIVSGMFDTVDGETAVWAEDEGWWGVYKGDEMCIVGINDQVIADGDAFRLEYINGFAS